MIDYVWRYLRDGKVRHALSGVNNRYAVCGRGPRWFDPGDWYGTGTQNEYERNACLPACKRCVFTAGEPRE